MAPHSAAFEEMATVNLTHGEIAFNLPKCKFKSSIINTLFGVVPLCLHLKILRRDSNASGRSVWPDATRKFTVPEECFEAEVIGFHMKDDVVIVVISPFKILSGQQQFMR